MQSFSINKLVSGGLITNYNCVSKCKHCLYACSGERDNSYISAEQSIKVFSKIKSMRCNSIHIGGGEPMMNVDRLISVLECAKQEGVAIEYVETNSSWFIDEEHALSLLMRLRNAGLQMMLVSISPFHNEYIPFNKVKGVLQACVKSGISVFPWTQEFYYDLVSLDGSTKHSNDDFVKHFGDQYFSQIPYRYWIHYGGRALSYFSNMVPLQTLNTVLNAEPCNELLDSSHFHIDLYGNYVPSLCIGQSIKMEDLGDSLTSESYPLFNRLLYSGIRSFYEYACLEFGFIAKEEYINKCHLCSDIRTHMVVTHKINSKELQPAEFYNHI